MLNFRCQELELDLCCAITSRRGDDTLCTSLNKTESGPVPVRHMQNEDLTAFSSGKTKHSEMHSPFYLNLAGFQVICSLKKVLLMNM